MNIEFYEKIRFHVSIAEFIGKKISLKKKGADEYHGLCPFHNEKTPSFTVSESKKFYHCFGCQAHGDVIKFFSETEKINYHLAAIDIAKLYSVPIPTFDSKNQSNLYDVLTNVQEFFSKDLFSNIGTQARSYLEKRNINSEIIDKFKLGFARGGNYLSEHFSKNKNYLEDLKKGGLIGYKDHFYDVFKNRLTIPIYDQYSHLIAFGARVLGNELPKYLNSPETEIFKKGEIIYGENFLYRKSGKLENIIVVEGYMDVISMYRYGFENVGGILGTAFTSHQLSKLWSYTNEIILCLDGDAAGRKAALKAIETCIPLIKAGKFINFVTLPENHDPDSYLSRYGSLGLEQLLATKISLSEMIWVINSKKFNINIPEEKANLEKDLFSYIEKLSDRMLVNNFRDFYRNKLRTPNKFTAKIKDKINIINNTYTEEEQISLCLLAEILAYPNLLLNKEIYQNFIEIEFKNNTYDELQTKILDFLSFNVAEDEFVIENLHKSLKNDGFLEQINILLHNNSIFIDPISKINSDEQIKRWLLLFDKYHIAMLKKEYNFLLTEGSEDSFKKAHLYYNEIIKIQTKIKNSLQEK